MQIGLKPQEGARSAIAVTRRICNLNWFSIWQKKKLRQWEKSPWVTQGQQQGANFWCWWGKTALGLFNNAIFTLLWTKGNGVEPVELEGKFKDKQLLPHNKTVNSVSHQWKRWLKLDESISIKWLIKLMDLKILVKEPSVCMKWKTNSGKSQFALIFHSMFVQMWHPISTADKTLVWPDSWSDLENLFFRKSANLRVFQCAAPRSESGLVS